MKASRLLVGTAALVAFASCKTTDYSAQSNIQTARRDALSAGDPNQKNRSNPTHFEGPFTVDGGWTLDPEIVRSLYKNIEVHRFGTFKLLTTDAEGNKRPLISRRTGKLKVLRDMHYHLGNGKVGMRPIPITDRDPGYDVNQPLQNYPKLGQTADGNQVAGSTLLDSYLREQWGMDPNSRDPIFALIVYAHPEFYEGELSAEGLEAMTGSQLKTENGMTHMGIYIGDGQTRNSPFNYHSMRWKISGYPANVSTISLDGVDQLTFNRNAVATTRLVNELNGGPDFPPIYKFDWYRTISLKDTIHFYAAWIWSDYRRNGDESKPFMTIIREDETWHTYCAEHATIITDLALNVPHNLEWYQKIWPRKVTALESEEHKGRVLGEVLFESAQQRYRTLTGEDLPLVEAGAFTPLWQQEGIQRPTSISKLGRGLAWSAETTSDLISNFLEQYAAWPDVNPVVSSVVAMGFMVQARERMGITAEEYLKHAMPLMQKMVVFNAITDTAVPLPTGGATKIASEELFTAYKEAIIDGYGKAFASQPQVAAMLQQAITATLDENKTYIMSNAGKTIDEAWNLFVKDAKSLAAEARNIDVVLPIDGQTEVHKYVRFYSPPAIAHRVASGIHESSEFVQIKTVATAFDARELRKSEQSQVCFDPTAEDASAVPCE